ncbi:MAG: mechanosensitive ion channel domain-containing protein [Cyanobacteriota bacterium]|nr:mechanosensitive ion channel domain-containing protein [Cyanobacteriota bacterium]
MSATPPLALQTPLLAQLAAIGSWLLLTRLGRGLPAASLMRELLLQARLSVAGTLAVGGLVGGLAGLPALGKAVLPDGRELRELLMSLGVVWTLWRWKPALLRRSAAAAERWLPATASQDRLFAVDVIDKLVGLLVALLVLVSGLRLLGVSAAVLLTTGGLGAAALAFGARTIVDNALSGVGLYLNRPFVVGDLIRLPSQNLQGEVETIGWFYTRLRDPERQPLHIPNATFTTQPVLNLSGADSRRLVVELGVRGLTAQAVAALVGTIATALPGVEGVDDLRPHGAHLVGYGAGGAARLRLQCHGQGGDPAAAALLRQRLLLLVGEQVGQAGGRLSD